MFDTPNFSQIQFGYSAPSTRGINPKRAILDTKERGRQGAMESHALPDCIQLQAEVIPEQEFPHITIECSLEGASLGLYTLKGSQRFSECKDHARVGHKSVQFLYRGRGNIVSKTRGLIPFYGTELFGHDIALPEDQTLYRKPFRITPQGHIGVNINAVDGPTVLRFSPPGNAINHIIRHPLGGIVHPRCPLHQMEPGYFFVLFQSNISNAILERQSELIADGGPLPTPRKVGNYTALFPDIGTDEEAMSVSESLIHGMASVKLVHPETKEEHLYKSTGFTYEGGLFHIVNIIFQKI